MTRPLSRANRPSLQRIDEKFLNAFCRCVGGRTCLKGLSPERRKARCDLTRSSLRLWFCLGVAIVAAAIADPMMESASNAGCFGPGSFTDHSTANVLPALLVGCLLALLYLVLRVRAAFAGEGAPREDLLRAASRALDNGLPRLLPIAFALQILVLYAMETAEQYMVWGHALGPTIWLGAPVFISLAAHAAVCAAVAGLVAGLVRALTRATLGAVRFIQALAMLSAKGAPAIAHLRRSCVTRAGSQTVCLSGIGERGPPLLVA